MKILIFAGIIFALTACSKITIDSSFPDCLDEHGNHTIASTKPERDWCR